jgi:choline transport protein
MADIDQERIEIDEKTTQQMFEQGRETIVGVVEGEEVNASGHRDQLARQYSIWSICGLALTIDNAWIALGGSITVAIGRTTITS